MGSPGLLSLSSNDVAQRDSCLPNNLTLSRREGESIAPFRHSSPVFSSFLSYNRTILFYDKSNFLYGLFMYAFLVSVANAFRLVRVITFSPPTCGSGAYCDCIGFEN